MASPEPTSTDTGADAADDPDTRPAAADDPDVRAAAGRPYPIEIALADGTVLRGIEHPADGPPLLFVHDLGDDLDAWGSVAPDVRSAGFRVICLELRGHGLSDGEPDPSATVGDVTGALAEVWGAFGPCGLVVYGTAARAAFDLGGEHGAPVHAVISPAPRSGRAGDGGDDIGSAPSMRVVFTGAHDDPVHEHVRAVYPKLRGQNMWISTGTALRGPALLQEHPHLVEQLVMFMRRHLTAYHLAWIAEQGSDRQDSEKSDSQESGSQESDSQESDSDE